MGLWTRLFGHAASPAHAGVPDDASDRYFNERDAAYEDRPKHQTHGW